VPVKATTQAPLAYDNRLLMRENSSQSIATSTFARRSALIYCHRLDSSLR
jgi:hypothetical protein